MRFDVTRHPTAGWLARQVTEAFPWDTAPRYLLRDRDASYGEDFRKRVEAMGITEVVTAPRSPWQNAYRRARDRFDSPRKRDYIETSTSAICAASSHRMSTTTTEPDY